jgi:large subunit ribosomal protein L3
MKGLIGKKLSMTQIYNDQGVRVPVTAIEVGPCVVMQRKTLAVDGYESVRLGFGERKERLTPKAQLGDSKKAATTPKRWMAEFKLDAGDELKEGDTVTSSIFEGVGFVDIVGVTKGRGFQGVVKRHRMRGGPMTHGGHSKRRVGSIGMKSFPARVKRGQRMPGHMGVVRITVQNLRVARVMSEDNVILVCGAVPGATGGMVLVKRALKKQG